MSKKTANRNEISKKYRWNIEHMYQDENQRKADLDLAFQLADRMNDFDGNMVTSGETLADALALYDDIWLNLEKVYVYSRMKRDEDNGNEIYQAICDEAMSAVATISSMCSFVNPQLIEAGEDRLKALISENPDLSKYEFYLMNLVRLKDHVLSKEQESLMAEMSQVTSATNNVFTILNNADMIFEDVRDSHGKTHQLTHGNYITYMESKDRDLRKSAYENMYTSYKSLINTLATNYNYNTKNDVVTSRIRKYSSSRAASLTGDNVPESVYDNLIQVVNDNLPTLHRYLQIRKQILGLDEMKMYDVYVPLSARLEQEIPFDSAVKLMTDALSVLGSEYVDGMRKGIDSGWIDVYENKGKTSGAYSFGSYNSHPYILLNYTDTLKDVFTLVHEMGHSMHSYYTRKSQPFIYGGHSIFTAEVASTVNENLLINHLLDNCSDKEAEKHLINTYIEGFRTTLFRQTMFSEFEHITHKAVEDGGSLTSAWLKSAYQELNDKYYGNAVAKDDFIQYEWARIPHFYNAFYVYKYATGYSAANAISKLIRSGNCPGYIDFLKSGESDHPIELLKIAGVDMSTREPVESAMSTFKDLVDRFEKLL